MKNPPTPAGIEPATFRFIAQHLNHCATAVPPYWFVVGFYLPTDMVSYPRKLHCSNYGYNDNDDNNVTKYIYLKQKLSFVCLLCSGKSLRQSNNRRRYWNAAWRCRNRGHDLEQRLLVQMSKACTVQLLPKVFCCAFVKSWLAVQVSADLCVLKWFAIVRLAGH